MRIDWDALLLSTSPAIASNGDAPDARCEEVPAGAGIASREREGDDRRRCSECGNLGERGDDSTRAMGREGARKAPECIALRAGRTSHQHDFPVSR